MKFFCHFGLSAFSNAYLIGPDDGGEAVLIDPAVFDETLLVMIEKNRLDFAHILVTHAHESHVRAIPTALKIYDATVYGIGPLPRVARLPHGRGRRRARAGKLSRAGRLDTRPLPRLRGLPHAALPVYRRHAPRRRHRIDAGAAARQQLIKSIRREILTPRRRDDDLSGTRAPEQGRHRAVVEPRPEGRRRRPGDPRAGLIRPAEARRAGCGTAAAAGRETGSWCRSPAA